MHVGMLKSWSFSGLMERRRCHESIEDSST
jgi:hypothetical protein